MSVCAMLFLAACASAERLIFIPTAVKTRMNTLRAEAIFSGTKGRDVQGALGFGLGKAMDAELIFDQRSGRAAEGSLNLAYYYIIPITDLTPGVSVGVQDLLDVTPGRRSFYAAVTYRLGQDGDWNSDIPAELTVGLGTERYRRGAFVGFMLPFADQLRLLGEYDSNRITAGLEIRPVRGMSLRALFQSDRTLWSLGYSVKF